MTEADGVQSAGVAGQILASTAFAALLPGESWREAASGVGKQHVVETVVLEEAFGK